MRKRTDKTCWSTANNGALRISRFQTVGKRRGRKQQLLPCQKRRLVRMHRRTQADRKLRSWGLVLKSKEGAEVVVDETPECRSATCWSISLADVEEEKQQARTLDSPLINLCHRKSMAQEASTKSKYWKKRQMNWVG
jgi:hypothetical protein